MKAVLFKEDGSIIGQMLVTSDITNLDRGIVCYEDNKFIGREVINFDLKESKLIFTKGFKANEELLKDRIFELENLVGELLVESMEK